MRRILLDTNALIALSDPSDLLFQYTETAKRNATGRIAGLAMAE